VKVIATFAGKGNQLSAKFAGYDVLFRQLRLVQIDHVLTEDGEA
jgi:hypothetical protein